MSLSAEIFGSDSWIFKLGNTLGLGIPSWANEQMNPGGQREVGLGDIARQNAEEGLPRTIVWGRVRPIGGTLMYCQSPQKRWIRTYEEGAGGSFGGGGDAQEVWTEHVFRTYAIGICEGPITGITRVWNNNRLVYDARGNAWGERNNPTFLANKRIYLGDWDQMPCPELQAIWGTDIPAHRGTAYMVWIDRDLTSFGGAIPQYQFEVERAEGVYLTSRPYAIEAIEGIESLEPEAFAPFVVEAELMDISPPEITGGTLRDLQQEYVIPDEAVDAVAPQITGGELRVTMLDYTDWPAEAVDANAAQITSGELRVALIDYVDWPAEAFDAGAPQITGGTLT